MVQRPMRLAVVATIIATPVVGWLVSSAPTTARQVPPSEFASDAAHDAAEACAYVVDASSRVAFREVKAFDHWVSLGHAPGIVYATSAGAVHRLEPDGLVEMSVGGYTGPIGGVALFGRYPEDLWARSHGSIGSKHGFVFGPLRRVGGSERFELSSVVPEDFDGERHLDRMAYEKGGAVAPVTCASTVRLPKRFVAGAATLFAGQCDPELLLAEGAAMTKLVRPDREQRVVGLATNAATMLVADEMHLYERTGEVLREVALPPSVERIRSLRGEARGLVWMLAEVRSERDGAVDPENAVFVGRAGCKHWARVAFDHDVQDLEVDARSVWVLVSTSTRYVLYRRAL